MRFILCGGEVSGGECIIVCGGECIVCVWGGGEWGRVYNSVCRWIHTRTHFLQTWVTVKSMTVSRRLKPSNLLSIQQDS